MKIAIDRDYLRDTLVDLVRINSINPGIAPTGPGEAEIAAYVADALHKLNLEVSTHEPAPGRTSVVGMLKGSGGGRSLMLNGHIDTVGIADMQDPFSATIRDGKLYGRGSYDMKGGLVAGMAAVKALVDAGASLSGDVLLAAVADEEDFSVGTAEVIKHHQVDGAIVTEPTELGLCVAHKGFMHVEIETIGHAAHGSSFEEGIDANMHMGRVLAGLDKLDQDLHTRREHPLTGPASLHAALIKGGTGKSTYAPSCKLQIERRTIPGETERQVVDEIQAIIDKLAAADPTFKAAQKTLIVRNPFEVDPKLPLVQVLQKAATEVLGKQPRIMGNSGWMETALFAAVGVPAVVMGPIGEGAHCTEEWVDLASVAKTAQVLAQAALIYCQ